MNMGDALRMNALKFGDKLAVRDASAQRTYRQLNERSNQLANGLAGIGLAKGQNVAVLLQSHVRHMEVLFGLAKAGMAAVPLDPKWKGREIASGIDFFDVKAVVVEDACLPALADALERAPGFHGPVVCMDDEPSQLPKVRGYRYEDLLEAASSAEPAVEVASSDLFLIMITSGTTGYPKGCMSTHEKYVFSCMNHALGGRGCGPDDLELLVSPLYFNSGRSSALGHIFWGATVILKDHFDPVEALETIEGEGVTYIALAPVMADRMLDAARAHPYDTSSLRHLRKAGSPFHPKTVEGLIERICPHIYQSYASTDAGTVSQLLPDEQLTHSGTSGKLIWAAEAYISDDSGTVLPAGEVGEIVCRGPLVCAGYYKNPQAMAQSFRDGWLLTGDLGRFDEEGYLSIVGRKKNMIKSGSISIFPEEIQEVLQAHPAVKEAGVVGVPHPQWGEAVVAGVSLNGGASLSEAELINYCKSQLASYKAPKMVRFLDELPHTELGKIATETLRAQFTAEVAAR